MLADEPLPLGKYLGDPVTAGTLNQTGGFVFRVTMGAGADIAIENAGIALVRGSPHGIADAISRARRATFGRIYSTHSFTIA